MSIDHDVRNIGEERENISLLSASAFGVSRLSLVARDYRQEMATFFILTSEHEILRLDS